MTNTFLLLKEEQDKIISMFKNNKTYSQIGKEFGRSAINIKNEINKYIKEQNHNGCSIYKLSKEFNLSLDKIKEIIDSTKLNDINYLEKHKMDKIIQLLKSTKKYNEVAKSVDTTKDTVVLYFKRIIKEKLNSGISKDEISKIFNISDNQIDKFIEKKNIKKKVSDLQLLKEENNNLKNELDKLRKQLEFSKKLK